MKKKNLPYYLLTAFFLLLVFFVEFPKPHSPGTSTARKIHITLTPTPTPFIFRSYIAPTIENKQVYKIVMIGDSMTAALGPHGDNLSDLLNTMYQSTPGHQRIIIDNFAKSSNILAVDDELYKKTTIGEYTFGSLLSEDFDLILVESYGYNPLSQFGLEGGLKKQSQALDALMKTLITTHPHAAIVFIATISPNIENYGKITQPDMSSEDRAKLAQERIAYIKNHIQYAITHNIPLINIYQKSLTENGDGNMIYINPTDDIHPSFVGINLINYEIGNFIYDNKILPQ